MRYIQNSNMKFLFNGLGSIGQRHLRNLHALGHREFFVYRTGNVATPIETEYRVKRLESFEAGLALHPDAVFITNPTVFHLAHTKQALAAGCHVFIEKPVSHTLEGVDELEHLAQKKGRVVFVGYQLRFHPILRAIKEQVDQGAIGKPLAAHISVGQYLPDWHPDEDYRTGYAARKELGGGAILTLSHEIDYALWLLGPARSVYALGGHLSMLSLDVEDVAKMLIEFKSGCIADIHIDYLQRPPGRTFHLIGEKGKIEWDYFSDRARVYTYTNDKPAELLLPAGFEKNVMYREEVAQFIRAVEGREPPYSSLADGIATLVLARAALTSLERKALITL